MMKLYLAGPLFSAQERLWNRRLAAELAPLLPGWTIVLPQDFKVNQEFNNRRHFGRIFDYCIAELESADCVLALYDGADADSGTCFEAGFAYAKKIPVVGLRTDFRESQERGVNLMLSRGAEYLLLVPAFHEDPAPAAKLVARKILQAVKRRR